ncbi:MULTISPECIES: AlbA family DNA-binding domain-containing protein [unclassified Frankia]
MIGDLLGSVRTHDLANLRAIGADIADVEVKKAQGGLPKSLRETLSGFANTRGGVIVLGLDEAQGFVATGLPDPARLTANLGSMCSEDLDVFRGHGASAATADQDS